MNSCASRVMSLPARLSLAVKWFSRKTKTEQCLAEVEGDSELICRVQRRLKSKRRAYKSPRAPKPGHHIQGSATFVALK